MSPPFAGVLEGKRNMAPAVGKILFQVLLSSKITALLEGFLIGGSTHTHSQIYLTVNL